jgi:hypothetical protein
MDPDPMQQLQDAIEDDFILSSSDEPETRPARAVISHVRRGERVCPDSAYHGSEAHTRAMAAKSESKVLESFLVCCHLRMF